MGATGDRRERIYPSDRVTLREVGLRDGLQLVKTFPDSAAKRAWLHHEHGAGVRHFEIGSFLPPTRFPQFADVRQMVEAVAALEGGHSAALALNERGAEEAVQTAVGEIVCVVSATEEHSQANMRRSRAEAVGLVRRVAEMRDAVAPGKIVNAGLAMSFGCSISGAVAPEEVLRLAEDCLAAGADIVGAADTVGYAGPRQVGQLSAALDRLCGNRPFILHLHDTRGMGIANAAAALDNGARVLDGSLGGLGGCPFAPGATGNVVFEDLVYLCETMGFRTGIDLTGLAAARQVAEGSMPEDVFYGALAKSGPPQNMEWRA
ncbi:hydroxymethylglutaryl-CoA lyase [Roseibium litorale]|uniref:Hydroxymethylglutaryl-CoA lyase n=1 Tax=Roseibium litorale TaxID=2803841 RepID=A0ABR9CRU3_9HYPH|nr:hydroxymethylglutaryl-CoA lyase [Roseibium litorale]MBD8893588.1 hydroxymethylglutaryl-CoA lyase [Roseibium litorale]